MSAVETATINELIIEYHRLTRQILCIYQDDAMGCYDRIIRGHATLSSTKFMIPDNICKVHSIAHNKMKFKTQINNKISSVEFTNTKEMPKHGIGQGAGNGGTKWNFISVPMMKIVEEEAPGCSLRLPKGDKEWKKHIVGFVDDKRHYVNSPKSQICKRVIKGMEQSVLYWYELLNFSGGELELDKCAWYIINWEFKKDKPQIKCLNKDLYIKSPNGKKIKSKQLQKNILTTYLGVTSQVNGEQSAQTKQPWQKGQTNKS